jgi:hypothetical protein
MADEKKKKVTRGNYWVHPDFDKNRELGRFVLARGLHQDSEICGSF